MDPTDAVEIDAEADIRMSRMRLILVTVDACVDMLDAYSDPEVDRELLLLDEVATWIYRRLARNEAAKQCGS